MIKIKDITNCIEEIAPLNYAEDFDNVGLLVGDYNTLVSGVLVTLDTLENVMEEALEKNCNLIVSFHPIIFSGLKKLNGKNYVERVVLKAIKNDIAIYALHTALDNHKNGVNKIFCNVFLKLILYFIYYATMIEILLLLSYATPIKINNMVKKLYIIYSCNVFPTFHTSFGCLSISTIRSLK